ncbi:hypothetical protein, partial [Alistipes sp.]|uniref:hypothetical protein n=1 Tax=Alistipes sp. TaxID=1872444 RepID=UPI003AF1C96D
LLDVALVLEVDQVEELLTMGGRQEPIHSDEIHLILGQRKAVACKPSSIFFCPKVKLKFATGGRLRNATTINEEVKRNV